MISVNLIPVCESENYRNKWKSCFSYLGNITITLAKSKIGKMDAKYDEFLRKNYAAK
jgi:hypothetical protein